MNSKARPLLAGLFFEIALALPWGFASRCSPMAGKRKLFIMHAGELANSLVHALKHHGLVANFVRDYAQRYHRPKLVAEPDRISELETTIGREALLSIAVEVRRLAPAAFADGLRSPSIEQMALADAFFAEFVASLGRALDWSLADVPTEEQALERDLEMYWRWRQRSSADCVRAPETSGSRLRFPTGALFCSIQQ